MQRILIVDDAPVIRKVARRIFEALHLEVQEVETASDAFRICQNAMPEGILIDAQLPGHIAVNFMRELRSQPGGTTPHIV